MNTCQSKFSWIESTKCTNNTTFRDYDNNSNIKNSKTNCFTNKKDHESSKIEPDFETESHSFYLSTKINPNFDINKDIYNSFTNNTLDTTQNTIDSHVPSLDSTIKSFWLNLSNSSTQTSANSTLISSHSPSIVFKNATKIHNCDLFDKNEIINDKDTMIFNNCRPNKNSSHNSNIPNYHLSMILECQSCINGANDTIFVLKCFHLICKDCLVSNTFKGCNFGTNITISCPLCDTKTFTQLKSTSDKFIDLKFIDHLANDEFTNMIVIESYRRICQSCLEFIGFDSYFLCADCGSIICHKCSKIHSFIVGCKNKDLKNLKELNILDLKIIECKNHPLEPAQEYCYFCRSFFCKECQCLETDQSIVSNNFEENDGSRRNHQRITMHQWMIDKVKSIMNIFRYASHLSNQYISSFSRLCCEKDLLFDPNEFNVIDVIQRAMQFIVIITKMKKPYVLKQIDHGILMNYIENIFNRYDKDNISERILNYEMDVDLNHETLADSMQMIRVNDKNDPEWVFNKDINRFSNRWTNFLMKDPNSRIYDRDLEFRIRNRINNDICASSRQDNIFDANTSDKYKLLYPEYDAYLNNDTFIKENQKNNEIQNKKFIVRKKIIYKIKFGDFGIENSSFMEPNGIASDKQDRIYVADTNSHCVKVLSIGGEYISVIGSNGALLYPNRVAVDPSSGNIVISERCPSHQIQIFRPNGEFLRRFGSKIIQYPRGLAVDKKSRIIVVECKIMRIVIFDMMGNMISKFNCCNQLQFPNNVTVNDDEEIFVTDNRLHLIQVFNYQGQYLRSIGHQGLINYPIGVQIDSKGRLIVADNHNNFNLTIFDSKTGDLIDAFESRTKHSQCYDIALLRDGELYMSSKDFKIYQYIYNISPERYFDFIKN